MESIKQTKFVTFFECAWGKDGIEVKGKRKRRDWNYSIRTYIHHNRFSRLTEMQLKVLARDEIAVRLRLEYGREL